MKIITIVGARPQFVKAAVVSRALTQMGGIEEIIIHTGQHYDENMSDIFFQEMKIPKPKYHLGVSGLSHGAMTGRMLEKIEEVLLQEKPDWVLVYGDTNSTLAGALAAKKLHVKLAHVEAGLRSFNLKMPEEINRILTDRISDLLFVPTDIGKRNLSNEGITEKTSKIVISGDVMYDAAIFYSNLARPIPYEQGFGLVTCHRAENTDNLDNLKAIVEALNEIHQKQKILWPVHPRTRAQLRKYSIKTEFNLIEPVGYLEMLSLIKNANLIMTDSGGLQKEAYFFEKPCITLRNETEWSELVESGCNILTGADKNKILFAHEKMMKYKFDFSKKFYGSGRAGELVVMALKEY